MFEGGLFGVIHLLLAIWAIVNIIQSRATDLSKVLWSAFVIIFPLIGIIVWFFFGPRTGRR